MRNALNLSKPLSICTSKFLGCCRNPPQDSVLVSTNQREGSRVFGTDKLRHWNDLWNLSIYFINFHYISESCVPLPHIASIVPLASWWFLAQATLPYLSGFDNACPHEWAAADGPSSGWRLGAGPHGDPHQGGPGVSAPLCRGQTLWLRSSPWSGAK